MVDAADTSGVADSASAVARHLQIFGLAAQHTQGESGQPGWISYGGGQGDQFVLVASFPVRYLKLDDRTYRAGSWFRSSPRRAASMNASVIGDFGAGQ